MRGGLVIAAGLAVLSAASCSIGDGTGSATGPLWILNCDEGAPVGLPDAPLPFNLQPTFFAGEPIGDIATGGPPQNRLIIRMQRSGNAVQINDTLFFDVPSSYEVARCLRGRTDPATGLPDWDTTSGTVNEDFATTPWCEPAGPNGVPRIHLFPFGPVRASLTPLATCHVDMLGPTVVSVTGVARDGWIDFYSFGAAAQPSQPPDMRMPVDPKFLVNFGDRLHADFHIDLSDDRTQTAIYKMINVPPEPQIGGTLDGFFDFDLERGRSGQTFP
jgi:hypothetical protein